MKLYASSEDYKLYEGNMLDMLEAIEPESIDAIVTDPPYGLTSITKRFGKEGSAPTKYGKDGAFSRLTKGFMGKEWDGSGIEYNIETRQKCLEVLKPGGYLLAFGGTRTYHRIACAIEDAGFEIRDCIMWLYGSGFPKSMSISKSIEAKQQYGKSSSATRRQIEQNCDGESYVRSQPHSGLMGKTVKTVRKRYSPTSDLAVKWQGWGTCLKPSFEPVVMARKPFKGSLVDNVLEYGVGGLNIDECRVGNEYIEDGTTPDFMDVGKKSKEANGKDKLSFGQVSNAKRIKYEGHTGRFPANVIHDGSEEATAGMPNTKSVKDKSTNTDRKNSASVFDHENSGFRERIGGFGYDDSGSASRYFYCAKASKRDRDGGLEDFEDKQATDGNIRSNPETARKFGANSALRKNIHPTVKPTALMQYLIRLVTPRGGVILDPFMGSGSTGKAAMFENKDRGANYKFIGIELTDEYLPIAKARIDHAKLGQVALPLDNKEKA